MRVWVDEVRAALTPFELAYLAEPLRLDWPKIYLDFVRTRIVFKYNHAAMLAGARRFPDVVRKARLDYVLLSAADALRPPRPVPTPVCPDAVLSPGAYAQEKLMRKNEELRARAAGVRYRYSRRAANGWR